MNEQCPKCGAEFESKRRAALEELLTIARDTDSAWDDEQPNRPISKVLKDQIAKLDTLTPAP